MGHTLGPNSSRTRKATVGATEAFFDVATSDKLMSPPRSTTRQLNKRFQGLSKLWLCFATQFQWWNAATVIVALMASCMTSPFPARASTILGVSIETLLAESSLVFEGIVIQHQPAFLTEDGDVRTCVEFDVVDIVKGKDPRPNSLTLCFSGGTVDGMTMRIGDSVIPAVGEHGLFFVESIDLPLVNPLLGWSQGHLRIEGAVVERSASGEPVESLGGQVLSERGRPVVAFSPGSAKREAWLSEGVAAGVVEGESDDTLGALSPDEVKSQLKALLLELRR